jgi:hypothetical protein
MMHGHVSRVRKPPVGVCCMGETPIGRDNFIPVHVEDPMQQLVRLTTFHESSTSA